MICLRVPDRVRRHVGKHEVGRSAERLLQLVGRFLVHEIHLEDGDTLDRIGREQVYPDDLGLR